MAIGDYTKTTWVNNTTPAIQASALNNIENKVDEIDANGTLTSYSPTIYGSTTAGTPTYTTRTGEYFSYYLNGKRWIKFSCTIIVSAIGGMVGSIYITLPVERTVSTHSYCFTVGYFHNVILPAGYSVVSAMGISSAMGLYKNGTSGGTPIVNTDLSAPFHLNISGEYLVN